MADDGTVRVRIPYQPRGAFSALHQRVTRWAAIVAHRRAGKTVACVNDLINRGGQNMRPHPPPRYGYLAPTYAQAKDVAWAYLKHYTAPIPGMEIREVDLQVTFPWGPSIRLYGADNYDRMRGLYFDGVVVDEPADIDPRAWPEVVRPALADHQGWAVFIGTPKGRNHFWELVTRAEKDADWTVIRLPASKTGILPQSELDDARRSMTEDQYAQEFECSFEAAIAGAYYARELDRANKEGRLCSVPVDRYAPVFTAWDLGYTDSTAIWFGQLVGQEIHWIDYYEASSAGFDHYADILKQRLASWGAGARYSEHYFPHDIAAHMLGMDRSRVETLRSLGIEPEIGRPHAVDDGINAVRRLFDKMWFDEAKCERGLNALRQYRREFVPKIGEFKLKPLHDWTSHGADAMRTFAAGWSQSPLRNEPIDRHRRAYYGKHSTQSWRVA